MINKNLKLYNFEQKTKSMYTMEMTYEGDLRNIGIHLQSGNTIITDAPMDNHGKGEAFSPTDLLCAALCSCMFTIMGIVAKNHNINMKGARAEIEKNMANDPRRVSGIRLKMSIPGITLTDKEKKLLENAARTCPVAKSLNPEIVQELEIIFY